MGARCGPGIVRQRPSPRPECLRRRLVAGAVGGAAARRGRRRTRLGIPARRAGRPRRSRCRSAWPSAATCSAARAAPTRPVASVRKYTGWLKHVATYKLWGLDRRGELLIQERSQVGSEWLFGTPTMIRSTIRERARACRQMLTARADGGPVGRSGTGDKDLRGAQARAVRRAGRADGMAGTGTRPGDMRAALSGLAEP